MKNKILPSLIVVVFAVLMYFLFFRPKDVKAPPMEKLTAVENIAPIAPAEAPIATSTPKQKHEVIYTGGGFGPAVLSVAIGDPVTFINKSSGAFWPASNPHPTHTDYPEFDAKTEIATGKIYEFTFTKPGAWGYHNHLNPKMMGVVIVK